MLFMALLTVDGMGAPDRQPRLGRLGSPLAALASIERAGAESDAPARLLLEALLAAREPSFEVALASLVMVGRRLVVETKLHLEFCKLVSNMRLVDGLMFVILLLDGWMRRGTVVLLRAQFWLFVVRLLCNTLILSVVLASCLLTNGTQVN